MNHLIFYKLLLRKQLLSSRSFLPLGLLIFFQVFKLQATILPSRYHLIEAINQNLADDHNLSRWLDEHRGKKSKNHGLTPENEASHEYARILKLKKPQRKLAAKKFQKYLKKTRQDTPKHPLYPYFTELIDEDKLASQVSKVRYFDKLKSDPIGFSCPMHQYIQSQLHDKNSVLRNIKHTKDLLLKLSSSQNSSKVKQTLYTFSRRIRKKDLVKFNGELKAIKFRHPQVSSYFAQIADETLKDSYSISKINRLNNANKCEKAKKILVSSLSQSIPLSKFELFQKSIEASGQCYRRVSLNAKVSFYKEILSPVAQCFGPKGSSYVKLLLAQELWNQNKNRKATATVKSVWSNSLKNKDFGSQAEALILWAKIAESEEKYQESIEKYLKFIDRFPNHEKVFDAYSAILVTHAGQQDWQKAYNIGKKMIHAHSLLADQESSNSRLAFALFWSGRAAYEIGKTQESLQYWKYAANDFFSSYYGALSHYMIEQLTREKYALQPIHTRKFDSNSMMKNLEKANKLRLLRVQSLLRIGLKKQARCEMAEIYDTAEEKVELNVMRSLLLYAAEDWLNAIKSYGRIPRSYRKTLPYGMEKILFPKKYSYIVEQYSKKANIDPDLIYSLIRQESVFNPRAYSSAGARGLMQLMSRTAQVEATRLGKTYVSSSKKKSLIRKVRRSVSLYEIETNVILGTHYLSNLFKRYQHIPTSLAAYNAGPTAVGRWKKRFNTSDTLYFIERIPYKETRGYVKLILRNYFYYKKWYGGAFKELPHLENLSIFLAAAKDRKNLGFR